MLLSSNTIYKEYFNISKGMYPFPSLSKSLKAFYKFSINYNFFLVLEAFINSFLFLKKKKLLTFSVFI